MKKLAIVLGGISWLSFLPAIVIYGSNAVSYSILYPLNICHQYNGNDFGASPLCDTFPAISYFGYIFSLSGILAIPTLIGVITLLSYFGTIFLYNRRNPNDIWEYSGWMKLLAVLLVLFSASLSLIAALAAMVHIVGTTIYNIFKKETPRQYDRWLIVLLILVLIFQLPRLLLLVQ